jgi:LysM repeat protein
MNIEKGFFKNGEPSDNENEKSGEAGFTRREVLGAMGKAAAGLALAKITIDSGGIDYVLEKYNEFMDSETAPDNKGLSHTRGQEEIEQEDWKSLEEIINYDRPGKIEFADTLEKKVVDYWKERYIKDPKLSKSLSYAYSEIGRWQDKIKAEFVRAGFGENEAGELLMLAIPESHMVYRASSGAGAAGIYQFMPDTGKDYGLKQFFEPNRNGGPDILFIDERIDPIKSGGAAARFLKKLLTNSNNDIKLALSGYNGGYRKKYLDHAEKTGEQLSYEGFLRFMEERINALRNKIRSTNHGTYKIKKGDATEKIAERFGVDPLSLSSANNNLDLSSIRPGQEIKIPYLNDDVRRRDFVRLAKDYKENLNYPGKLYAILELIRENPEAFNRTKKKPPLMIKEKPLIVRQPQTIHIYNKQADTYAKIAKKYNINLAALYGANREIDPKKIKDGTPLKLPTTQISLEIIAQTIGRSLEDIKLLNPHILNPKASLPEKYEVRI